MTIEQAIEHAEDVAISAIGCECREEHRQLAAWLRELQERKAQPKIIRCKDCKYAHLTNDGKSCKYCDQFTDDYGQVMEMYFDSDFYCGYAEGRTDD